MYEVKNDENIKFYYRKMFVPKPNTPNHIGVSVNIQYDNKILLEHRVDSNRWAAVEVNVGGNQLDEAAKNLIILKDKIDTDHMKEPSFMMIVYGGTTANKNADGIFVVPIGMLKNER